jgi:hypothetical protein
VSCELVLVSIVMNIARYAGCFYIVPILVAPHLGRQTKQAIVKKSYIRRLVDEYMGHMSAGGTALCPSMFITDVAPTNVAPYIHRCHVTNKYILNSSVPMNVLCCVRQQYIHRCAHRLIDEFNVYSLV